MVVPVPTECGTILWPPSKYVVEVSLRMPLHMQNTLSGYCHCLDLCNTPACLAFLVQKFDMHNYFQPRNRVHLVYQPLCRVLMVGLRGYSNGPLHDQDHSGLALRNKTRDIPGA